MSRLKHSVLGFLRTLQMSRTRLHVFVEGRQLDGYVYGRLSALECPQPFEYTVRRADELPGSGGGGKAELIAMHDYLRAAGALTSTFKGGAYTTAFFLDKDVDDLLGKRKRSIHIIYTRTYDIEGEVFLNGDLADAVAAACTMDPGRVRGIYVHRDKWMQTVMNLWREWVVLCVTSQLTRTRSVCNFGVPTRVNPKPLSGPDPMAVNTNVQNLRAGCPSGTLAFAKGHSSARRRVSRRYSEGRAQEVFKGKWFAEALDFDVARHFPDEHARVAAFKSRIVGHLAQSLIYDGDWTTHYRSRLQRLLTSI